MAARLRVVLCLAAALSICGTGRRMSAQAAAQPDPDVAVYQSVLADRIRPEVDRFSAGAGLKTPAPVLTFDRTLMMCPPRGEPLPQMGCLAADYVVAFEAQPRGASSLLFAGKLTSASRTELGKSLRERNRDSRPFPGEKMPGIMLTMPAEYQEAIKRESNRTRGIVRFSSPAYSSDGHALVFASYVCGGLCGYGWFFLLQREGESWQVVDVALLWIS